MSNLLIVGNGFDTAHGLETRYCDFREYLFNQATGSEYTKESKIENPKLPDVHIHTGKGILYSLEKDCGYVFSLIDEAAKGEKQPDLEWNKFEELLGKLNYRKALEENSFDELVYMGIRNSLGTLENIFFEWIKTVTIDGLSKKKFLEVFINPEKDLLVNFNYTETAEVVYGMDERNICYIHGKREMDTELIEKYHMTSFGVGNRKLIIGYDGNNYNPKKRYSKYKDSKKYGMLVTLDTELMKRTEEVVYENRDYFKKISETDIQNVLSFGFSFSGVDIPQIKAICEALNGENKNTKKMTWYLNDYDKKKNRRFKRIIRKCGYRGRFKLYESENKKIYTRFY